MRSKVLRLIDAAKVMLEPGAIGALAGWPHFSLTSFKMLLDLSRQGIVPATVIDVGANVGQFAVSAAKMFPKTLIHSFEPAPDSVEKLRSNVSTLPNVKVYPVALGEAEGTVNLHINAHNHSSSILRLTEAHRVAFPDAREIGTVAVKVITLDDVFREVELSAPVLLKLDVQGYEAMTLRGAKETLKRIDYAVLEGSLKPMYDGETLLLDLVQMMEDWGFKFLRPIGFLADPETGEVLQIDALFGRSI